MSDTNDEQFVIESQKIQEEQITIRLDFPRIQVTPQVRTVILRHLGFSVADIVGMSLDETQVGDIVVELVHNGFYTRAQVYVKMQDGARRWVSSARFQQQYHFTSYLA